MDLCEESGEVRLAIEMPESGDEGLGTEAGKRGRIF
jgi:hypothetical protein